MILNIKILQIQKDKIINMLETIDTIENIFERKKQIESLVCDYIKLSFDIKNIHLIDEHIDFINDL